MNPLTREQANIVYDILVSTCKAQENLREDFVNLQTNWVEPEYRFQGALGFGGKFWRFAGGQMFVCTYPEDRTPERRAMINLANNQLKDLW